MTGRPGHWSEPGEYHILFLGSVLVISSQGSYALGYREFTQEGAMTISPFAAREGTSAPQWSEKLWAEFSFPIIAAVRNTSVCCPDLLFLASLDKILPTQKSKDFSLSSKPLPSLGKKGG